MKLGGSLGVGSLICVCAFIAPAAMGSAQGVELGATGTPLIAPTCPPGASSSECTIVLERTTALETVSDAIQYPTMASQPGTVVAFTVGVSELSDDPATRQQYVDSLDQTYGGNPQVAITVLRRVGAQWRVLAESPLYQVQANLGQVVRFSL